MLLYFEESNFGFVVNTKLRDEKKMQQSKLHILNKLCLEKKYNHFH